MDNGLTIKSLLVHAAKKDSSTALLVRKLYNDHIQRERVKVIDFDGYSKSVWRAINTRYTRYRDSEQYDLAYEVLAEATETITKIGDKASAQHTSFGTKRSALETLRKIGKTICLSGDVIGYEVRKQFQHESALEDAMSAIVAEMSVDECQEMCAIHDGRSSFLIKMEELLQLSGGYCLFARLEDVLVSLAGEVDEDGDEDGDGEDEDHEEESVTSDVPKYDMYGKDAMFDNSEEEEEWMECYDSCSAPKDDAKSRWILDRHERKRARRGR
jgi:hypothetical protein